MTYQEWDNCDVSSKQNFLLATSKKLMDYVLEQHENKIDAKALVRFGITEENKWPIFVAPFSERRQDLGGHAIPPMEEYSDSIIVEYNKGAEFSERYVLHHELIHAVQYIYEFNRPEGRLLPTSNSNIEFPDNSSWMKKDAIVNQSFHEDLQTLFYYYDPIEQYANLSEIYYILEKCFKDTYEEEEIISIISSRKTKYARYRNFIAYYKARMEDERTAPRCLDDLRNSFTATAMYLSVKKIEHGLCLLNTFLPEDCYLHEDKIFSMSDDLFRETQEKTLKYIQEVFKNFDRKTKDIVRKHCTQF